MTAKTTAKTSAKVAAKSSKTGAKAELKPSTKSGGPIDENVGGPRAPKVEMKNAKIGITAGAPIPAAKTLEHSTTAGALTPVAAPRAPSIAQGVPAPLDARAQARFRKLLLEEKQRLINNSKNALKTELVLSTDDLPDETDLAVSEINQNLIFKLRDRERQLLVKIDEALARMDEGTFGICEDCEEPIEPRRLEARPVSTLCIACKEKQEHREKIYA